MRPTLRPLALTLCACALLGCPAKLPAGATALDKITIDGADDVSDSDVTDAIASQPTSKVLGLFRPWWVDYGTYDPVTVEKDLQRIERFFQARGYYEARVRAGRVIPNGERSVRVQIVVEEGQIVNVSKVLVSGLEGLPVQVRRKVSRAWTLAPGDPFDEDKYHAAGAAFEGAFTDNGYAYATVKMGADVDLLKHEAVIHLEVVPGPVCTFGAITITGLDELTDHAVRKVLDIKPGDPYSTRTMREAQNALFDLGTFDTVNFEPDLTQKGRTEIPVKVVTVESKLRRVKAGPGFLFDPVRSDVHFIAGWEHRNFFGGLRRFSVEARPMAVIRSAVRPGLTGRTELRQPSFIEARTHGVIGIDGGLLPDAVNDYQTLYAHGSMGIDRRFLSIIYAGLFYRKWLENPMAYNGTQLPGNVFPAQVGFFEALFQVDARNDLLKPTKGFFIGTSLQYALAPSGDPNSVDPTKQPNGLMKSLFGDFHDVRIQPEIRLYGPLSKRITLAFRLGTGFLIPFNYTTGDPPKNTNASDPSRYASVRRGEPGYQDPPIWRAFFSGGATDNRGYPTRQVGLRDCDYAYPTSAQIAALPAGTPVPQPTQKEFGQDCSIVVGGASMWTGSMELRFDISGPFGAVLFLDASDVSRRTFDIRLDYPHLSAGPGLRYVTPVGPVRVDFGYRLPGLQRIGGQLDPREIPNDFNLGIKGPFALHFSLGEAF